jgi:hypothetical protein
MLTVIFPAKLSRENIIRRQPANTGHIHYSALLGVPTVSVLIPGVKGIWTGDGILSLVRVHEFYRHLNSGLPPWRGWRHTTVLEIILEELPHESSCQSAIISYHPGAGCENQRENKTTDHPHRQMCMSHWITLPAPHSLNPNCHKR